MISKTEDLQTRTVFLTDSGYPHEKHGQRLSKMKLNEFSNGLMIEDW